MTAAATLRDAAGDTTAPPAEAEVIDRGWAVWHNAMNTMWPASVRKAVRGPVSDLHEALVVYSELLNEDIRPAEAYSDLPDDALTTALERAEKAVGERTGDLVRVFPACGTEGGK